MDLNTEDRLRIVGDEPRDGIFGRLFTWTATFVFLVLFAAVAYIGAVGEEPPFIRTWLVSKGLVAPEHSFATLYTDLGVTPLPAAIETNEKVREGLMKLERERCDRRAITTTAEALRKMREERWAADAYLGFAAKCGSNAQAEWRRAADLYLTLGDYPKAHDVGAQLVAAYPDDALAWYIKGKAEANLKLPDDALMSYATTIQLSKNPRQIGDWVFYEMSDIYAGLARFCEAMVPIQNYVSLDPGPRNMGKARKLIEDYAQKGHCSGYASGSATLPVFNADVIKTRVMVNGVAGLFIVDTGASFVSIAPAFAQKAHLVPASPTLLRATTANGATYTRLATASTVRVGDIEAAEVPVMVMDKPIGDYDGLLGRSFLSRFDVMIASDHWTLSAKSSQTSSVR